MVFIGILFQNEVEGSGESVLHKAHRLTLRFRVGLIWASELCYTHSRVGDLQPTNELFACVGIEKIENPVGTQQAFVLVICVATHHQLHKDTN